MKKLILLIFVVAASLNAQSVQGQIGQVPVVAAADNSPVGGAGNLTTVGAVPYVSASGILNQDPADFFWDATNNRLGIGTATPGNKLAIVGSGAAIRITGANDTGAEYLQINSSSLSGLGYVGVEGSTPGSTLTGTLAYATFISAASSGSSLQLGTPGGIRATISAAGNVGLGTTAPVYLLDVAKSGASGTARVYDQTATTGSTLAVFRAGIAQSGNVLEVQNNAGATTASISSTGGTSISGSFVAAGNVIAGSTQDVGWSTRSTMNSPSSGVISLYNSVQDNFNRLQFGGTTSSFPSIQRSTTKLFFRLADDSAGATIKAGGYESSDGTAGVTVTTCTAFKNGLCISGM